MGAYFHYFNLTKRERFIIGALGGGIKFFSIGRTLAVRAFELMLTSTKHWDRQPSGSCSMLGHWAGDAVAILGDDNEPDWAQIEEAFIDVEANAILLVYHVDGFEQLGEAIASNDSLFMEICHLVVTQQAKEFAEPMKSRFGPDFLQRYGKLCKERRWFLPKDVAAILPVNESSRGPGTDPRL